MHRVGSVGGGGGGSAVVDFDLLLQPVPHTSRHLHVEVQATPACNSGTVLQLM